MAPSKDNLERLSLDSFHSALQSFCNSASESSFEINEERLGNEELRTLVGDYFEKTSQMLEFFPVLEEFLMHARCSRSIVLVGLLERENGPQECCTMLYSEIYAEILHDMISFKRDAENFQNLNSTYLSLHGEQLAILRRFARDHELSAAVLIPKVLSAYVVTFAGSIADAFLGNPPLLKKYFALFMASNSHEDKERLRGLILPIVAAGDSIVKHVRKIKKIVDDMHAKVVVLTNHDEHGLRKEEMKTKFEEEVAAIWKELKAGFDELVGAFQVLTQHADECSSEIRQARAKIFSNFIHHRNRSN